MNDATPVPEPDVSAEHPISEHWIWVGPHRPPCPRVLFEHMTSDWAVATPSSDVHPAATFSAARRTKIGARFADQTLVIPTGNPKVRANDTDYRFRAGTDFFYLTGCNEPDAVLVIAPSGAGPRSTLYVPHRRDHHTHEFFTDARYGELWVGARRGVEESAVYYDVATAPLEYLEKDLASLDAANVLTLRGFDEMVDALFDANEDDDQLAVALSEQRLVKDDFEIAQLQLAISYTVKGFEDVVRALPIAQHRGERVIEGIFNLRARVEGNDVGYDTIAASGSHATTLHWTRNDGEVHAGDLLLLDAGVECHNLYTADVTRTMPINGKFTPAQRRIYELVLKAQKAGIAAVKPGVPFMAPNDAAMKVLAEGLFELGILRRRARDRPAQGPPVTTPLHPARREPHAGHRRARLRQRAQRDLPRRPRGGLRAHRRARSVLPAQRPHGPRGVPRDRRAHRRRRARDRDGREESLRGAAARATRGRRLDDRTLVERSHPTSGFNATEERGTSWRPRVQCS